MDSANNELNIMAPSEKNTTQKDNAAEAKGESLTNGGNITDSDGLSPDQEDALAKIMAEIEGQDDAAPEKEAAADPPPVKASEPVVDEDPAEASDEPPTDNEGLDSEQEDALNKIMAEIEGQDDAAPEKEASADPQPVKASEPADEEDPAEASDEPPTDNEGLDSEQEDALNKIMAEIEGQDDAAREKETATDPQPVKASEPVDKEDPNEASDEPPTDNEGLDSEQEDALNKIMAEIEGSSGTEDKDEAANEKDSSQAAPSEPAENTKADKAAVREADVDVDVDEGLSADQEDALKKIMAEMDAKDDDPPAPGEERLSEEQEAALKNILAEIDEGGEGDSPSGQGADDDSLVEQAPAEAPAEAAAEAQVNAQKEEAVPSDESPVLKTAPPPEEDTIEKPPSSDDLMNQIQAAAQGPAEELNVSAPSPEDVKASPSVTESNEKVVAARTTAPLAEVDTKSTPSKPSSKKTSGKKKKGLQKRKPASKKIVKILAWSGSAVAAVLLAAVGTYYWLSYDNSPSTAAAPPTPVTDSLEMANEQSLSDLSLEADLLAETSESPAPANMPLEISPASERLAELSSRIQTRRDDMLAKAREIDDLSAYYQEGIAKITREIVGHINTRQITSLAAARKDTAILMGLETIQRRADYITKLSLPRQQVHTAAEELLYLARKAGVLSMIASKSSGSNLDPFAKQVDETIERLTRNVTELSLEDVTTSEPTIEDVWKTVWAAHLNAPKKEPPATVAMRRNNEIGTEVCKGDFRRVGELSALSGDAAACLAAWEGKDLFLNNLKRLSPDAARSLSQWKGEWLVLNGLKTLSPEAAKQLATWRGKRLSLNGLEELPSTATQALEKWQGHQLELIGLRRLAAWDNPQVTLYVRSEVHDNLAP